MASHCHQHHHQAPAPCTHCCCNPSHTCCTPPRQHPHPTPPPPQDHLIQAIASLLSQQDPIPTHLYPHYPKSHTQHNLLTENYHYNHQHQQHQNQTHSTISSLLHRIESLESSLNHHTHQSSHSLRDTAARIIQTHFRSFLVRRSKTLRHLKHLAFIKTTFNSLKSSFSNEPHIDFAALSLKAVNLLLQLDSIEGCDPMVMDGKRLISRELVEFLNSIEGVVVKKHLRYVKAAKNARFGERVNKSRNSGDDEKRKLLQNLRGRVEKISRLCKVSANDEQESEPEGIHHVVDDYHDDDDDGVPKNGVFVQRKGVQPRVKKNVRFAENGKISEALYSSRSTSEPDLNGDVTCLDGSSSSDEQGGEVLENVNGAVEDVVDSSQGVEDDEEALVNSGGSSPHSSDDGERNSKRGIKNDGRNEVKGQLLAHQEKKLLFSAPLPLKMENIADLMKSKGVRILT